MTVKELIEALKRYPEDYHVVIDDGESGVTINTTFIIYEEEEKVAVSP